MQRTDGDKQAAARLAGWLRPLSVALVLALGGCGGSPGNGGAASGAGGTGPRISAGAGFSYAVKDGTAFVWGLADYGQLGNGPQFADVLQPKANAALTDVVSMSAAGLNGTAIGGSDQSAWVFGYRGVIDCEFGENYYLPAKVQGALASDIVEVGAGGFSTALLRRDGVVLNFGCNDTGELGRNGSGKTAEPVPGLPKMQTLGRGCSDYGTDENNDVWHWGASGPASKVAGVDSVTALACGGGHVLARRADGSVYAWGRNDRGQLGDGTQAQRAAPVLTLGSGILAVSAGGDSSLALRDDFVVLAWGSNQRGQLGVDPQTLQERTTPDVVAKLTNAAEISLATDGLHVLAVDGTGAVWSWGDNSTGQLGDGTRTSRHVPAAIAGFTL